MLVIDLHKQHGHCNCIDAYPCSLCVHSPKKEDTQFQKLSEEAITCAECLNAPSHAPLAAGFRVAVAHAQ